MPGYADALSELGPNPDSPQGAPPPTGIGAIPVGNAAKPVDDETSTAAYWLNKMKSKYPDAAADIQGWIAKLSTLSAAGSAPAKPPGLGPPPLIPPAGGPLGAPPPGLPLPAGPPAGGPVPVPLPSP